MAPTLLIPLPTLREVLGSAQEAKGSGGNRKKIQQPQGMAAKGLTFTDNS